MGSVDAISRRTVREALGTQLTTALTSALAVYDFLYSKFDVESPIVRIITDGSNRPPIYGEGIRSTFYYALQFWVAYYEEGDATVQQEAEDILDALEHEFVQWLEEHQISELWTMVRVDGRSRVQTVQTRGSYWIVETIPIVVEVYG